MNITDLKPGMYVGIKCRCGCVGVWSIKIKKVTILSPSDYIINGIYPNVSNTHFNEGDLCFNEVDIRLLSEEEQRVFNLFVAVKGVIHDYNQ